MKKSLLFFTSVALNSIMLAQTYLVSTAAGSGSAGFVDGASATCQLNFPYGVAADYGSAVYFSDLNNNAIRKLDLSTGIVSTIAGTGIPGYQDGAGTTARFNSPDQLAYSNGYLYVSDIMNHRIRRIDLSNNTVSTIAGSGIQGHADGASLSSQFNSPNGIAVASNGDVYICDAYNYCIRKISGGQVTTVAGIPGSPGSTDGAALSSTFNRPRGIAIGTNGTLYVTDIINNKIRKISGGMVTTYAGTGTAGGANGSLTSATFNSPVGITITPSAQFMYVVDGGGHRVRKISVAGNTISTIAGTGSAGFLNSTGSLAQFDLPQGITYDVNGSLYVADRNNNRIRKIEVPEIEVGISESAVETDLKLFPNPSTGLFSIAFGEEIKNGTLTVYDAQGRIVAEKKMNNVMEASMDMGSHPEGLYLVTLQCETGLFSHRIIIRK